MIEGGFNRYCEEKGGRKSSQYVMVSTSSYSVLYDA